MVFGAEQGQVGLHKQHKQRRQARRPATTKPSCPPFPLLHPLPNTVHPRLPPLPPRLASHVLLRPLDSYCSHLVFIHPVACPPCASVSLVFVLIQNDSPSYFGDEIPQAAARLILNFNSDVVGCPQEMKTHHVGPQRTRDGRSEGGAGL